MILSVDLPDQIAHRLRLDGPHSNRRALEIFALEGYRSGELSRGQVGELLGLGFSESEQFLKDHHAHLGMTIEEFREDSTNLERILGR